jgi:hypothetical protein
MGCSPNVIHHQANEDKLSHVQCDAIKDNILPQWPSTKTMHDTANSQKEISTSNGMLHMMFHCPSGRQPWQAWDAQSLPQAMSTSYHTSQISQSTSYVKGSKSQSTSYVKGSKSHSTSYVKGSKSHSTSARAQMQEWPLWHCPPKKNLRGGHVLSTCPSVEVKEDHVLLDVT